MFVLCLLGGMEAGEGTQVGGKEDGGPGSQNSCLGAPGTSHSGSCSLCTARPSRRCHCHSGCEPPVAHTSMPFPAAGAGASLCSRRLSSILTREDHALGEAAHLHILELGNLSPAGSTADAAGRAGTVAPPSTTLHRPCCGPLGPDCQLHYRVACTAAAQSSTARATLRLSPLSNRECISPL